jgi:uracil-DNA glycosylase family 4
MEDLFKKNLLRLRTPENPKTFSEALWNSDLPFQKKSSPAPAPAPVSQTEKKMVLESLERFAQEKLQESDAPAIPVEGGEIVFKKDPLWDLDVTFADKIDLFEALSADSDVILRLLEDKGSMHVKVIFVSESFLPIDQMEVSEQNNLLNELLTGFPLKTAELFEKMIKAMKLTPEEVIFYAIDEDGQDLSADIVKIASFYRPEVIITLGAKATQKLLGEQNRLSLVHGQFFKRDIQKLIFFDIVPLFHPSIIETNQNMKKTAWTDMQKIMRLLKKLL